MATAESYLVVWAGDWNAGDHSGGDTESIVSSPDRYAPTAVNDLPGPDFLAVVNADAADAGYGTVVGSVTVPGAENEPHHMQYSWRPGQRVFAGGLFSDETFIFDVDDVPVVRLEDTILPHETPCGSVPDAYWTLADGTAIGTYMGGPNIAGDPRCNGGINNGFAGTPGTVVRIGDPDGDGDYAVLGEFPADTNQPVDSRQSCASNPPLVLPSCANPHGIQVREDLGLMVTSDYAEPRNVPIDPLQRPRNPATSKPAIPGYADFFRDTVRVWDIHDLAHLRVRSVSVLDPGSMGFDPPPNPDSRGVMGIMETTVTNRPGHRGAFASSMCGGQVYYTADITLKNPMWRQVFDASAAAAFLDGRTQRLDGCIGAGWLQTSPDDAMLFQAVIGRRPGTLGPADPGVPKMVYALDVRDLVAVPSASWRIEDPDGLVCTVSEVGEVLNGGAESTCPSVTGAIELVDRTTDRSSGGPHWGAIDNFSLDASNGRVSSVTRIAAANYFVARSGLDGDHRICMIEVSATGALTLDAGFVDERTGGACVSFNRPSWPHGPFGWAKPHSMLFVRPSS